MLCYLKLILSLFYGGDIPLSYSLTNFSFFLFCFLEYKMKYLQIMNTKIVWCSACDYSTLFFSLYFSAILQNGVNSWPPLSVKVACYMKFILKIFQTQSCGDGWTLLKLLNYSFSNKVVLIRTCWSQLIFYCGFELLLICLFFCFVVVDFAAAIEYNVSCRGRNEFLLASNPETIISNMEETLGLHAPVSLGIPIFQEPIGSSVSGQAFPLMKSLASLILEGRAVNHMVTPLLLEEVHFLVSVPRIVSDELYGINCRCNFFNAALYVDRLCDSVLWFLFQSGSQCLEESNLGSCDIAFLCCLVIESLLKDGKIQHLLTRLRLCILDGEAKSAHVPLTTIAKTVFEFSLDSRSFILKRTDGKRKIRNKNWSLFVEFLLNLIDARPSLVSCIREVSSALLEPSSWSESPAYPVFCESFTKTFFHDAITYSAPSRAVLKFLFRDLLQNIEEKIETSSIRKMFFSIAEIWQQKKWVEHASVPSDASLMSSIIYIIFYYESKEVKMEPDLLSSVLDGVSLRLATSRQNDFREHGMTVAAAFAASRLDKDGAQSLLENSEFQQLFQKWVDEESMPSNSRNRSCTRQTTDGNKDAMTLVLSLDDYPMNPDKPFFFFSMDDPFSDAASIGYDETSTVGGPELLPAFGMTKRNEELLETGKIRVLQSVKECYNALVGIGRTPNAQVADVQQDVESALRGFDRVFRRTDGSEALRATTATELGPLVPSLLQCLVSIAIHAPEEKTRELLSIRYATLVHVIEMTPQIALYIAGNFVYSGSLGIAQRVEVARAIGDAAVLLSQRKVEMEEKATNDGSPRVYPPIRNSETGKLRTAEGKSVRKWGYANRTAQSIPTTWNALADHCTAFVNALIARYDDDHFKFFQDSDPYTPSPDLCASSVDFFAAVLSAHPELSVKKIGWIAFEELMRCWCGAQPHYFVAGDELILNRTINHRALDLPGKWLTALKASQEICNKLIQKGDASATVAIHAVASLTDLATQEEDFLSIAANSASHNNFHCVLFIQIILICCEHGNRTETDEKSLRTRPSFTHETLSRASAADTTETGPSSLNSASLMPNETRPISALRQKIRASLATSSTQLPSKSLRPVSGERSPTTRSLPCETFYDPATLSHATQAMRKLTNAKLFNDADEVLRKKEKADTEHYMKLAFRGRLSNPVRVKEVVEKLSAMRNAEAKKDTLERPWSSRDTWISVLYALPEEDIQLLWDIGFLDLISVEDLLAEGHDENGNTKKKVENEVVVLEEYLHSTRLKSENVLDAKLHQFLRVSHGTELTKGIQEASLSGNPEIDLAPVMEKVMAKEFSEVTAEELEALQRYEESESVELFTSDSAPHNHGARISKAYLDRALVPSNQFIAAVALYDERVSKSLEDLERIKRRSLLDPVFQEAVRVARAMDEKEMPSTMPSSEGSSQRNEGRRAKRRHLGGYKGSKNPFEKLRLVTDLPYFYGSPCSIVPPHGRSDEAHPAQTQEKVFLAFHPLKLLIHVTPIFKALRKKHEIKQTMTMRDIHTILLFALRNKDKRSDKMSNLPLEADDWDAEQYFTASAIELSKGRNEAESAQGRFSAAAISSFRETATPCEDARSQALQCLEGMYAQERSSRTVPFENLQQCYDQVKSEELLICCFCPAALVSLREQSTETLFASLGFINRKALRYYEVLSCGALWSEPYVLRCLLPLALLILLQPFPLRIVTPYNCEMAPRKNKRKDQGRELTEDDMRRMGMSDSDIARIIAERSKSSDEKRAEQEREEAHRREAERRARMHKEVSKKCEELEAEEQTGRVTILEEEDQAFETLLPPLLIDKTRVLRQHAILEAARKHQLARKQREEKLLRLREDLEKLPAEERAAITAELQEKENEKTLAILEYEEAKRRKAERRAARIAAQRAKGKSEEEFSDIDSGDDLVNLKDFELDAEMYRKMGFEGALFVGDGTIIISFSAPALKALFFDIITFFLFFFFKDRIQCRSSSSSRFSCNYLSIPKGFCMRCVVDLSLPPYMTQRILFFETFDCPVQYSATTKFAPSQKLCEYTRSLLPATESLEDELEEGESSATSSSTDSSDDEYGETPRPPFYTVPFEVFLVICSFLTEQDYLTLLGVSRYFHRAITEADSVVWRSLCLERWRHRQGCHQLALYDTQLEEETRREERWIVALTQRMLPEWLRAMRDSDCGATEASRCNFSLDGPVGSPHSACGPFERSLASLEYGPPADRTAGGRVTFHENEIATTALAPHGAIQISQTGQEFRGISSQRRHRYKKRHQPRAHKHRNRRSHHHRKKGYRQHQKSNRKMSKSARRRLRHQRTKQRLQEGPLEPTATYNAIKNSTPAIPASEVAPMAPSQTTGGAAHGCYWWHLRPEERLLQLSRQQRLQGKGGREEVYVPVCDHKEGRRDSCASSCATSPRSDPGSPPAPVPVHQGGPFCLQALRSSELEEAMLTVRYKCICFRSLQLQWGGGSAHRPLQSVPGSCGLCRGGRAAALPSDATQPVLPVPRAPLVSAGASLTGRPSSPDGPQSPTAEDQDEEDDPAAYGPVSWKFAYYMSRREARRTTITLHDLEQGMWLMCLRTTGRCHPVRFHTDSTIEIFAPLEALDPPGERGAETDGRPQRCVMPFHIMQSGARLSIGNTLLVVQHRSRIAAHPAPNAEVESAIGPEKAAVRFGAEPNASVARIRQAAERLVHSVESGVPLPTGKRHCSSVRKMMPGDLLDSPPRLDPEGFTAAVTRIFGWDDGPDLLQLPLPDASSEAMDAVDDDWGWTISSDMMKFFSVDLCAPFYIRRLQRDGATCGSTSGIARRCYYLGTHRSSYSTPFPYLNHNPLVEVDPYIVEASRLRAWQEHPTKMASASPLETQNEPYFLFYRLFIGLRAVVKMVEAGGDKILALDRCLHATLAPSCLPIQQRRIADAIYELASFSITRDMKARYDLSERRSITLRPVPPPRPPPPDVELRPQRGSTSAGNNAGLASFVAVVMELIRDHEPEQPCDKEGQQSRSTSAVVPLSLEGSVMNEPAAVSLSDAACEEEAELVGSAPTAEAEAAPCPNPMRHLYLSECPSGHQKPKTASQRAEEPTRTPFAPHETFTSMDFMNAPETFMKICPVCGAQALLLSIWLNLSLLQQFHVIAVAHLALTPLAVPEQLQVPSPREAVIHVYHMAQRFFENALHGGLTVCQELLIGDRLTYPVPLLLAAADPQLRKKRKGSGGSSGADEASSASSVSLKEVASPYLRWSFTAEEHAAKMYETLGALVSICGRLSLALFQQLPRLWPVLQLFEATSPQREHFPPLEERQQQETRHFILLRASIQEACVFGFMDAADGAVKAQRTLLGLCQQITAWERDTLPHQKGRGSPSCPIDRSGIGPAYQIYYLAQAVWEDAAMIKNWPWKDVKPSSALPRRDTLKTCERDEMMEYFELKQVVVLLSIFFELVEDKDASEQVTALQEYCRCSTLTLTQHIPLFSIGGPGTRPDLLDYEELLHSSQDLYERRKAQHWVHLGRAEDILENQIQPVLLELINSSNGGASARGRQLMGLLWLLSAELIRFRGDICRVEENRESVEKALDEVHDKALKQTESVREFLGLTMQWGPAAQPGSPKGTPKGNYVRQPDTEWDPKPPSTWRLLVRPENGAAREFLLGPRDGSDPRMCLEAVGLIPPLWIRLWLVLCRGIFRSAATDMILAKDAVETRPPVASLPAASPDSGSGTDKEKKRKGKGMKGSPNTPQPPKKSKKEIQAAERSERCKRLGEEIALRLHFSTAKVCFWHRWRSLLAASAALPPHVCSETLEEKAPSRSAANTVPALCRALYDLLHNFIPPSEDKGFGNPEDMQAHLLPALHTDYPIFPDAEEAFASRIKFGGSSTPQPHPSAIATSFHSTLLFPSPSVAACTPGLAMLRINNKVDNRRHIPLHATMTACLPTACSPAEDHIKHFFGLRALRFNFLPHKTSAPTTRPEKLTAQIEERLPMSQKNFLRGSAHDRLFGEETDVELKRAAQDDLHGREEEKPAARMARSYFSDQDLSPEAMHVRSPHLKVAQNRKRVQYDKRTLNTSREPEEYYYKEPSPQEMARQQRSSLEFYKCHSNRKPQTIDNTQKLNIVTTLIEKNFFFFIFPFLFIVHGSSLAMRPRRCCLMYNATHDSLFTPFSFLFLCLYSCACRGFRLTYVTSYPSPSVSSSDSMAGRDSGLVDEFVSNGVDFKMPMGTQFQNFAMADMYGTKLGGPHDAEAADGVSIRLREVIEEAKRLCMRLRATGRAGEAEGAATELMNFVSAPLGPPYSGPGSWGDGAGVWGEEQPAPGVSGFDGPSDYMLKEEELHKGKWGRERGRKGKKSGGGSHNGMVAQGNTGNSSAWANAAAPDQNSSEGTTFAFVEFKRGRVRKYASVPDIPPGKYVMVDGDRGQDCGLLVQTIRKVPGRDDEIVCMEGTNIDDKLKLEDGRVIRLASEEEVKRLHSVIASAEALALKTCRDRCKELNIEIGLVDVEYQYDMKKISFFFDCDHSVDFRSLVRELYRSFGARIWMENINPRRTETGAATAEGRTNTNGSPHLRCLTSVFYLYYLLLLLLFNAISGREKIIVLKAHTEQWAAVLYSESAHPTCVTDKPPRPTLLARDNSSKALALAVDGRGDSDVRTDARNADAHNYIHPPHTGTSLHNDHGNRTRKGTRNAKTSRLWTDERRESCRSCAGRGDQGTDAGYPNLHLLSLSFRLRDRQTHTQINIYIYIYIYIITKKQPISTTKYKLNIPHFTHPAFLRITATWLTHLYRTAHQRNSNFLFYHFTSEWRRKKYSDHLHTTTTTPAHTVLIFDLVSSQPAIRHLSKRKAETPTHPAERVLSATHLSLCSTIIVFSLFCRRRGINAIFGMCPARATTVWRASRHSRHVKAYLEGVPAPQRMVDRVAGADLRSNTGVGLFTTAPRYVAPSREQRLSSLFFHHILYPAGGARAPYQPIVARGARGLRRQVYPVRSSAAAAADPLAASLPIQDIPEALWTTADPARPSFFYSTRSSPSAGEARSPQRLTSSLTGFPRPRPPPTTPPERDREDAALSLLSGVLENHFNTGDLQEKVEALLPSGDAGYVYFSKATERGGAVATGAAAPRDVLEEVKRRWPTTRTSPARRVGYVQLRLPEAAVGRLSLPGDLPREVCRLAGGVEPCVPFAVGTPLRHPTSSNLLSQTLFAHLLILARVEVMDGCTAPASEHPSPPPSDSTKDGRSSGPSPDAAVLGNPLDPPVPLRYRTLVEAQRTLPATANEHVTIGRGDAETFFVPRREVQLTVFVPSFAEQMCAKQNEDRVKKQADLGCGSGPDWATSGRLTCSKSAKHQLIVAATGADCGRRAASGHMTYQIRAVPGDVVFIPRGWGVQVRRVLGGSIIPAGSDSTTHSTMAMAARRSSGQPSPPSAALNTQAHLDVDGFFLLYQPYPVLTKDQASVYVPANYVHTGISEFYANGGNKVYHNYE
eukprot:gene5552-4006_t